MKTLLLRWNFLFAFFLVCSVPLLTSCGDDDDDKIIDEEGGIGGTYLGWKDDGNAATFGYKWNYGGISASALITLTFDGNGEDAKCIKCVIEETYPSNELAEQVAASYRADNEGGYYIDVKQSGKKVTYQTDDFNGQTRKEIRRIWETAYGS